MSLENNLITLESHKNKIIEHVWAYIKQKIGNKTYSSVAALKEDILKHWQEITPEFCRKLIMSMKSRARAVLNANGYSTKY